MKPLSHILIALLLGLPAALASAEIYRWTNAGGVVSYGDVPPAGVEAEVVKYSGITVYRRDPERDTVTRETARCDENVDDRACQPATAVSQPPEQMTERQNRQQDQKAADSEKHAVRRNRLTNPELETVSERIKGYDKRERIEAIKRNREALRSGQRGDPESVSTRLRKKSGTSDQDSP